MKLFHNLFTQKAIQG